MAVPVYLPPADIRKIMATIIMMMVAFLDDEDVFGEMQDRLKVFLRLLELELEHNVLRDYNGELHTTLEILHLKFHHLKEYMALMMQQSSESVCTEDCPQVGLIKKTLEDETAIFKKYTRRVKKEEDLEEEELTEEEECSLFWLLVSGVKRTFWTAVPISICIVGWHLFQIHYSM